MAIHGGCACGAVRYFLSRDEYPQIYCCHCRDCQSRSGSAFVQTAILDPDEMEVTGPVVTFNSHLPSGTGFEITACSKCFSTLFSIAANIPDKLLLRAGSFDESDRIVPVAHIYTSRKQPWLKLPGDVLECEGAPTPAFFRVMGLA